MKKILLSIFLCLPFLLSAQPYTIKHLSIREGLSNNHVVSIAQDKRGSLWFATEEGLNKFDGIRFLTYYKEETTGKQSITGNELNCLLDDPIDSHLMDRNPACRNQCIQLCQRFIHHLQTQRKQP